jgi:hypothetical protein
MVRLSYPGGGTSSRPLAYLEPLAQGTIGTIDDRLRSGHFGKLRDLQRLITFETEEPFLTIISSYRELIRKKAKQIMLKKSRIRKRD